MSWIYSKFQATWFAYFSTMYLERREFCQITCQITSQERQSYLITRVRAIKRANNRRKRVTVAPSILIGKCEGLHSCIDELLWVVRVGMPKHNWGCCQGCRSLTSHIRSGVWWGHFVYGVWCLLVFWAHPAAMILVRVANLIKITWKLLYLCCTCTFYKLVLILCKNT